MACFVIIEAKNREEKLHVLASFDDSLHYEVTPDLKKYVAKRYKVKIIEEDEEDGGGDATQIPTDDPVGGDNDLQVIGMIQKEQKNTTEARSTTPADNNAPIHDFSSPSTDNGYMDDYIAGGDDNNNMLEDTRREEGFIVKKEVEDFMIVPSPTPEQQSTSDDIVDDHDYVSEIRSHGSPITTRQSAETVINNDIPSVDYFGDLSDSDDGGDRTLHIDEEQEDVKPDVDRLSQLLSSQNSQVNQNQLTVNDQLVQNDYSHQVESQQRYESPQSVQYNYANRYNSRDNRERFKNDYSPNRDHLDNIQPPKRPLYKSVKKEVARKSDSGAGPSRLDYYRNETPTEELSLATIASTDDETPKRNAKRSLLEVECEVCFKKIRAEKLFYSQVSNHAVTHCDLYRYACAVSDCDFKGRTTEVFKEHFAKKHPKYHRKTRYNSIKTEFGESILREIVKECFPNWKEEHE